MEHQTIALLIPIVSVIGAFIMIVYLRKYENQERMAMIEKGIDLNSIKKPKRSDGTVSWSFLLIGVGLGLLVGYFLDVTFDMEEVGYFSMIFIFGGAGLGLSYLMTARKDEERMN
ncbi:MAG: hypothetical protein HC811_03925 [Flammeovirgaceae bacterium]|nr:hypothetical protein [Flammeovirgaceae bacterium]